MGEVDFARQRLVAADQDAPASAWESDLDGPLAVVVGSLDMAQRRLGDPVLGRSAMPPGVGIEHLLHAPVEAVPALALGGEDPVGLGLHVEGGHGASAGSRDLEHPPRAHEHGHTVTAFGALHGLAGTAPVVALIPVTSVGSTGAGIAYLAAFGVGTALAMGLYAMFAGVIMARAAAASGRIGRVLARTAGAFTVVVGMVWLLR